MDSGEKEEGKHGLIVNSKIVPGKQNLHLNPYFYILHNLCLLVAMSERLFELERLFSHEI